MKSTIKKKESSYSKPPITNMNMKYPYIIFSFILILSTILISSCFEINSLIKRNHYEWLKQEYSSYVWELVDNIDDVKEINIEEYDNFLIVFSPQVPESYLLSYKVNDRSKYPYPQNNSFNASPFGYWYIMMSRLYEGGNYFDINNNELHLALIALQRKLYENKLSISQVYSDGECRINYGIIQLPKDFADFSNIDSLELVFCDDNDSCADWKDLKVSGF